MYCAACGSEVSKKLNYCKNCGAKIAKDEDETPKSMIDYLLTSLAFIVLGGFGILVGLTVVLLKNGFDQKGIMLIAGVYLATLFGISYLLLRQLPKLIDAKLHPPTETPEGYQPPSLFRRTTAQLEEPREPFIGSVTENTTRTFDKIPRAKN
jgi:hypothetical protein